MLKKCLSSSVTNEMHIEKFYANVNAIPYFNILFIFKLFYPKYLKVYLRREQNYSPLPAHPWEMQSDQSFYH